LSKKNLPQRVSTVLPSLQYSTPSQETVEGIHISSLHLRELFSRQPTDISAKQIAQRTVLFACLHIDSWCLLSKMLYTAIIRYYMKRKLFTV